MNKYGLNCAGSTNFQCRICNNSLGNSSIWAEELMYSTKEEFKYVVCANCGCVQIEEVPSNISAHYPADYYSYSLTNVNKKSKFKNFLRVLRNKVYFGEKNPLGSLLIRKSPAPIFELLSKLSLNLDSAILDVGCGSGALLADLSSVGFKNLHGIDPYNRSFDSSKAGKVHLETKNIFQINEKYDLVMFNHVFEHIEDQVGTLTKVHNILKPKGACFVRIPTVTSMAWHKYGTNWVQFDAPRHLYLHSIESIRILSERCGFILKDVIFDSTGFQFWGSEQNLIGIGLLDEGSYAISQNNSFFKKSQIDFYNSASHVLNKLNFGDSAAFYLYKN